MRHVNLSFFPGLWHDDDGKNHDSDDQQDDQSHRHSFDDQVMHVRPPLFGRSKKKMAPTLGEFIKVFVILGFGQILELL